MRKILITMIIILTLSGTSHSAKPGYRPDEFTSMIALKTTDAAKVERMLKAGYEWEASGKLFDTVASNHHRGIITILVREGRKRGENILNEWGNYTIQQAIIWRNPVIISELIDLGVNPDSEYVNPYPGTKPAKLFEYIEFLYSEYYKDFPDERERIREFYEYLNSASPNTYAVIKGDKVNLRVKPSLKARVIDQLNTGDRVIFIDSNEAWYHVRTSSGYEGWVYADYAELQ
ncbi:MAG: SH3 domain-containing protein [Synergistaceae bacterium]|nr:SH3 domain-containing protein [Synergistaceae bacterium]